MRKAKGLAGKATKVIPGKKKEDEATRDGDQPAKQGKQPKGELIAENGIWSVWKETTKGKKKGLQVLTSTTEQLDTFRLQMAQENGAKPKVTCFTLDEPFALRILEWVATAGEYRSMTEHDLPRGCQIAVFRCNRSPKNGYPLFWYWHHGVWNGEQIIELSGTVGEGFSEMGSALKGFKKPKFGIVKYTTLEEFGHGNGFVMNYISAENPDAACATAAANVGTKGWKPVVNCEHFAAWCVQGTPLSKQIDPAPLPREEVTWIAADEFKGETVDVNFRLCKAAGVKAADANGKSDPYVTFTVTGEKRTSQCIQKTLDPTWNEDYHLGPMEIDRAIKFEVWDKDAVGADDFLGFVVVPVVTLSNAQQEVWFDLQARDEKDKDISGKIAFQAIPGPNGPPPSE